MRFATAVLRESANPAHDRVSPIDGVPPPAEVDANERHGLYSPDRWAKSLAGHRPTGDCLHMLVSDETIVYADNGSQGSGLTTAA